MPAYALKPLALVAPVLGAPVVVRERPGLDRVAVLELLAGAELELGDMASARDQALEQAKLATDYGDRQAAVLTETKVIAALVGVGAALLAGLLGFVVGDLTAGQHAAATR